MAEPPPIPEPHLQQLQSRPTRAYRRLFLELELALDFLLVPTVTALLTLIVAGGAPRIATPSPLLLVAGLVVFWLQYRRGRAVLLALLAGLLACLIAWLIVAAVALVIGAFKLLDCFGAGGGCLPW